MDWSKITRFKPKEFPSKWEVDHADPKIFQTLNTFAEDLSFPVYPSPVHGALARDYGSKKSQHYAVGRLSTAVDFFPDCSIRMALLIAVHYFGGVGLYFDTYYKGRKWTMVHCDLREKRLLWYRINGKYKYVHTEAEYNSLIDTI